MVAAIYKKLWAAGVWFYENYVYKWLIYKMYGNMAFARYVQTVTLFLLWKYGGACFCAILFVSSLLQFNIYQR